MTTPRLTREHASHFADIALGHVGREYPNNVDHALAGPADARTPSQLHPIFYGSYDWHSCVHGYWMLARLLRRFPDFAAASDIRALFDTQFVPDKVAARTCLLRPPDCARLQAALWLGLAPEARDGVGAPRLTIAGAAISRRWPRSSRSAFATSCRWRPIPYVSARISIPRLACGWRRTTPSITKDEALANLLRETGQRWYGEDTDCPAWGEPSGDDFQSSALIEAECMRRLLPAGRVPALVRSVPAAAGRKAAGNAVRACDGHRSHGRQDRASRRAQSQPRLVLALSRRRLAGKATPAASLLTKRRASIWPRAFPILPAIIWASIGSRALPFSRSTKRNERTGSRYPLVA